MKWITVMVLTLLSVRLPAGPNDYYMTLSTIKARPLALGGAFAAMQNEWAALYYNPAGYHVSRTNPDKTFAAVLNPLGALFAFSERDDYSRGTVPLGWTIQAAGVRRGKLCFGLLIGEESLANADRLNRPRFFDGDGYQDNRNGVIGLAIEFAPRVRFGMAGDLFIRRGGLPKVKFGYRYGLIVKPRGNLDVGLCYVDFPKQNADDRMPLERLADGTLNIGAAYTPFRFATLFADVRNVSGEVKAALLEPHVGAEIFPTTHVALRGGYYRARGGGHDASSFGIGCPDLVNGLFPDLPGRAVRMDCECTFVWQRTEQARNQWIFLALRLIF